MGNNLQEIKLAKSASVVLITSGIRWLLGCVRIIIVAFLFGATFAYDAYLAAFAIPEMVTELLVGVIAVSFIPIFTEHLVEQGETKAWDFASSLINITFVVALLLTIIMMAIAPFIVRIAAPGFNQETFQLAIRLIIIIFPIVLIVTLAELVTRILNTYQRFAIPNLIRVLEVFVVIMCLVSLSKRYGIFSLAYGILLGAIIRLFFQLPLLRHELKYFRFKFGFQLLGIKKVNLIAGPAICCMLFLRVGTVIERLLASTLKEGSISVLGYATTLTQVPSEIFLGSLGIVLFPLISKYVAEGRILDFKAIISKGIRIGNFVLVPIAALFIFFGKVIIRALLERGEFVSSVTQDTSVALAVYALSLFAMAVYFFTVQACYALQEIKIAIKIAVLVMILNIILKLVLINPLSFAGLALATSIALIVQSGLLFGFIRRKLGSMDEKVITISSLKILVSSVLMVGACWVVLRFIPPDIHHLTQLIILIVTAGVFYLLFSYMLRSRELTAVRDLLKKMVASKALKA